MHEDHAESDMSRVLDLLARHLFLVHFPAYPVGLVWGFFYTLMVCLVLSWDLVFEGIYIVSFGP